MSEGARVKTERGTPPAITAEELDAKFDAGEDVSEYFDWENAVSVEPGEMSPGQKLSIIEAMINDLLKDPKIVAHLSPIRDSLNIPLSALTLVELGRQAARARISREALVQSWIEQKLAEQKAAK